MRKKKFRLTFSISTGTNTILFGVDTQELDVVDCAEILNELKPMFNKENLRAFPVTEDYFFLISRAVEAYQQTYKGSKEKVILKIF